MLDPTLHFQTCSHQCLKLLPLQQLRICTRHLQQSDPSRLSLTSLSGTAASVPCTQNLVDRWAVCMQVGLPCSSRSQNAKATDHLFLLAVAARACPLGVETVPFRAIAGFTFPQLVYLLVVYGRSVYALWPLAASCHTIEV